MFVTKVNMSPNTTVIIKAILKATKDFIVLRSTPETPIDPASANPSIIPLTKGFPGKFTRLNKTI